MTLVTTAFNTRTTIVDGVTTTVETNAIYLVMEGEENIGHVNVHSNGLNFNINKSGTLAEIRAQVSTLLAEMAALTTPQEGE